MVARGGVAEGRQREEQREPDGRLEDPGREDEADAGPASAAAPTATGDAGPSCPGLRSRPRARAGGPSAMMLIHSSWTARRGTSRFPASSRRFEERGAGDADGDEEHERDVGGEQEPDELEDVGVDAAALFDRGGDGGEVVVEEHEVGDLAADVAASLAHGDADVRPFQGGGVVDAVSGHGDDLAVGLEGVDEGEFVLGVDPGEHPDVARLFGRVLRG